MHGKLHRAKAEVDQALVTAEGQLTKLRDNFRSKITEYERLQEQYKALETGKEAVETDLRSVRKNYEKIEQDLQTTQDQKEAVEADKNNLSERVKALEKGLATDEQALRESVEARAELSATLITKTEEYDALDTKYKAAELELERLRKELSSKPTANPKEIKSLTDRIDAAGKELQQWQRLTEGANKEQRRLKDLNKGLTADSSRYKRNTIISYVLVAALALTTIGTVAYNYLTKDKPAVTRPAK